MNEDLIRRSLPQSAEAEQAVIGSMLMSREAVQTASEILSGDDFFQSQYGVIFDAMVELFEEGSEVDLVTLQDRLRAKNVPPEISEMEYVRDLLDAVPTSANVRYYANIVSEKSILRRLIHLTEEVGSTCYLGNDPVETILDESEKKLFALFQQRNTTDFVPIQKIVMDALKTIDKAARTKGNVTGLPTGFTDLDYKTSGLQNAELILIAARPSMGKTAFMLNIAEYMALRQNLSVALFSLEMSKLQLANRLLAMGSQIDSTKLRNGKNLKEADWSKLIDTAGVLGNSRMIIDDTPGISVRELRTKCRKYKLEHGLDIVMIDYLQLMSASGRSSENRQQEVSEITRALKGLARELNVPVVVLSQLSRAVEKRKGDQKPILSDLRESGAIEQDADVVMFLYREDYYTRDVENGGVCEVIIAKQRNGPIGSIHLGWIPSLTKFVNRPRESGGEAKA